MLSLGRVSKLTVDCDGYSYEMDVVPSNLELTMECATLYSDNSVYSSIQTGISFTLEGYVNGVLARKEKRRDERL